MTKAKGRARQSRGLVDMSETAAADEFLQQFEPSELLEERVDFDLGPGARCIQKFLTFRGRVVWFSIVQQVWHDDEWSTVIRADTCHSEAHVHRLNRAGKETRRQSLCDLANIEDVENGFDHASDLITEEWEENERRWKQ